MAVFLVLLGAAGFALALAGVVVVRKVAPRVGLLDKPGGHKTHGRVVPLGGGVAIYLGLWAPVWAAALACVAVSRGWTPAWAPEELLNLAPGVLSKLGRLGAIWAAATAIAGMGLVDDLRKLPPLPRFVVQLVAALFVFACGIHISIFIENAWVTGAITVLWIVALTNSFNWLDNMDGISGGVALISSCIMLAEALQAGQCFIAAGMAPLIGALAGFLVSNWPPASTFMGDCGGMATGFFLAAMSAEATFYQPERPLLPVVLPLLIFGLPLFDLVSVMPLRFHQKRPLYLGDNNHFSHRLVALGMTRPLAVLTVCLVTLALGLLATVLYYASTGATTVIFIQALVLIAIILVLERAATRKKP